MSDAPNDMSGDELRQEVATFLPVVVPLGRQAIELSEGLADAIPVLGRSRLFGGRDLAIATYHALGELIARWKEGLDDAAMLGNTAVPRSFGPGEAAAAAAEIVGQRVDAVTEPIQGPHKMLDSEVLNRAYTLEEYLALPEGPPDYEFEDGALVAVKSSNAFHGRWMGRLFACLDTWTRPAGGFVSQEVGTILDQRKGYIPDLIYITEEHMDRLVDGRIQGIPDLAVEIYNRDGAKRDRVKKFNVYLLHQVPWYWLVDYDSGVLEEYHLEDARYVRTTAAGTGEVFEPHALPGLTIPVDTLV